MVRGSQLRGSLVPALDAVLGPDLDEPAWQRYREMKDRYRI
jgi:hypothetical protein